MLQENSTKLFIGNNTDSATISLIYYYLRVNRMNLFIVPLQPQEQEILKIEKLPALFSEKSFTYNLFNIADFLCQKSGLSNIMQKTKDVNEYIAKKIDLNGQDLVKVLNEELKPKTFLVLEHISLADIIFFVKALAQVLVMQIPEITALPNLHRWISLILSLPYIKNILEKICPSFLKIEELLVKSLPKPKEEVPPAKSGKKEKKEKPKKAQPPPPQLPDVSAFDFRVGKVIKIEKHPDSQKLYLEEVDLGNGEIRKIASGLQQFTPLEELNQKLVCIFCNLKEKKLGGYPSHGMILCASNSDHSKCEVLFPPQDCIV